MMLIKKNKNKKKQTNCWVQNNDSNKQYCDVNAIEGGDGMTHLVAEFYQ